MELAVSIAVALHLLCAVYFAGSLIFMTVIGSTVIRQVRPPSFQRAFAQRIWRLTHRANWIALIILLGTGGLLLHSRGFLLNGALLQPGFYTTPFGQAFGRKLLVVIILVGLTLTHDLFFGPGGRWRELDVIFDRSARVAAWLTWLAALAAAAAVVLSLYLPT